MKKRIGVLFLSLMMLATISLAAYPAELEEQELQELETLENSENGEYGIEPISEEAGEAEEEYEVIEDDLYQMDRNITITQIINGNVYVMGETVKIKDTIIYGNVYVMAQEVEIENVEIDGSVYVMAEKMNFSGTAYDVYACGSKIDFDLNSYVWRNVKVAGDEIKINGNIGRSVYAGANHLSVGDNAIIEGALKYVSKTEGDISSEAQIEDIYFEQEQQNDREDYEPNAASYVFEALNVAFQTLIVVLILVFCVGKFKALKRTDNVAVDFLKNTGKGSLWLIFVPIVSILLMISVIGIGFGIIVLTLYIISLYIALAVTSVEITHRILAKQEENEVKKGKMIGVAVLISLVIWAIKFIPVLGSLIRFIAILIGLGIMSTLIFQKNKKEEINENEKGSN